MAFAPSSTVTLILATLGTVPLGCARDHTRITPTTSGTDLRHMPRGRMTPLPFPGSSLARIDGPVPAPVGSRPGPKLDPATITTAEETKAR